MIETIKHFEEVSVPVFERLEEQFMKNPTDIASYVLSLTKELHNLGLTMIRETLETMDSIIKDNVIRKEHWVVERTATKQLTTSLGDVCFKKTLYTNRTTNKSEFLLDRVVGLDKHERITEDALAKLLEETVQTSYRKGGNECSLESSVTKQTVMNKLHSLEFPNEPVCLSKSRVEYLYIDADEDHISLQYRDHKGDLSSENGYKNNCLISKLIYVYEGIENEAPHSKRHKLINPHYFSSVCDGKENEEFWDSVYEYIESHYDISYIKKIYLNSDGGAWIKSGMRRIANITYALDEFHLEKYIIKLTSHMLDSTDDARKEIYDCIRYGTKAEFIGIVERLKNCLPNEVGYKRLDESMNYILSNWMPARARLRHIDGLKGCSAEGHISHILSSRMSSRPMGWSKIGAKKMSELRAYYYNGGDMLELARYQKDILPKVSGDEYNVLSASEVAISINKTRNANAKYIESITHTITGRGRQYLWLQENIHW